MPVCSHPHVLGPGIVSRLRPDAVAHALASIDLVVADIDECLFPGFSQTVLGEQIFADIVTRPDARSDVRFVPQLLAGALYLRRVLLARRLLGHSPTNEALMRRYERSMRGIPEVYFRRGVGSVVSRSYPGALETLALLGTRVPLGLISFGIHLVAEEYVRQIDARAGEARVRFAEANCVTFVPGRDGRRVFAGYAAPVRSRPRDKRERLQARMDALGARCPLVLGNGPDEGQMAEIARERGGLAIGFRPGPAAVRGFDVVVQAGDWWSLHALCAARCQR